MKASVLWRRLSPTDFRAINGEASPHGRGGGAMHIALGVRTNDFPIDDFLDSSGQTEVAISVAGLQPSQLTQIVFNGNPRRRGGEWRICDQFTNRHPAWRVEHGFPSAYDPENPPHILLFKVGKSFFARFALRTALLKLNATSRLSKIGDSSTGIAIASAEYITKFKIPSPTRFEEFEQDQSVSDAFIFTPASIVDGRRRIFSAIIQRMGQQSFRRKLVKAYDAQCSFTKCKTIWVLEAAHIIPYKGLHTNSVNNGLLLRADVHTLFDLGLISIDPHAFVMKVSRRLNGSIYEKFDGREPTIPSTKALQPSIVALKYHYRQFQP